MIRLLASAALLTLAACAGGPSGRAAGAPPLQSVTDFKPDRYLGTWYEIARYPNSFQRHCEGVTVSYVARDNGTIGVSNVCGFGTKSGKPRTAKGTARPIEGSNGSRLAVNFAPVPLPKGQGNYWVLYVDTDYQHALVGSPSGKYLWMLARAPEIRPEVRDDLNAAATDAGYDLSLLKDTEQR